MSTPKRWTDKEARALFLSVDLEPLEDYRNIHHKWKSRCLKCGELQEITLHMVKTYGYGCLYCNGKRVRPSDAVAVLASRRGEPLEPFPGSDKPWRCRCTTCGREVTTVYKVIARKNRVGICYHCSGKVLPKEHIAAVMAKAHFEPLAPFPGADKPWKCRCLECGVESSPRFSNVQKGHGCLTCGNRRRGEQSRKPPSPEDVAARNLEPLEPYPGRAKKWRCRCLKCGREVTPTWGNLLFNGGDGCITCGAALRGQRQLRDNDEVTAEMIAAGVKPLEPYPGSKNPWRCECLRCGKVVATRYLGIQRGEKGCLDCGNQSSAKTRSKSAQEAEAFMRAAGYEPLEPYKKSSAPWKCRHDACGAVVSPSLATIQQGHGGCKGCAAFGIDYTAPAILYLMTHEEFFSIKVGITGSTSMTDRIGVHEQKGWTLVRSWSTSTGFEAEEIEGKVLSYWRDVLGAPASVQRDEMPQGGWTETASLLFVEQDETCSLIDDYISSK